jgi:endo-alpha-1,4-polygalactosaminidase (GH114 family)
MFRTSTFTRLVSRRTLNFGLFAGLAGLGKTAERQKWVVYYSNLEPSSAFSPYSTVVFDSRYHPDLAPLKSPGRNLMGYLSLGEASPDYSYFGSLRSQGLLLQPSAVWNGNYSIDIRDQRWWSMLSHDVIPQILGSGFNGLFLDTLDTVLYMEEQSPNEYSGMASAAKGLIQAMRNAFPGIPLIMNRAYGILQDVAPNLMAVLGESVYTTYDFAAKTYVRVSRPAYEKQVQVLRSAVAANPRLQVLTLDYWNPNDARVIREIYRVERANEFSPYVCTIDLTRLVPEL